MDADSASLAEQVASLMAELAIARAKASEDMALIAQQKLRIAKLEHQIYGQRSERSARLIDQLALTFEELESSAIQDELAAEQAVAKTTVVAGFTRKRLERTTFPDHLPRERVVIDPPTTCECCGSHRLDGFVEHTKRVTPICLIHFKRKQSYMPAKRTLDTLGINRSRFNPLNILRPLGL